MYVCVYVCVGGGGEGLLGVCVVCMLVYVSLCLGELLGECVCVECACMCLCLCVCVCV